MAALSHTVFIEPVVEFWDLDVVVEQLPYLVTTTVLSTCTRAPHWHLPQDVQALRRLCLCPASSAPTGHADGLVPGCWRV